MIPDKPEFDLIQEHFNPFGVKVTDAETLQKFGATYLLPAYMTKHNCLDKRRRYICR